MCGSAQKQNTDNLILYVFHHMTHVWMKLQQKLRPYIYVEYECQTSFMK